MSTLDQERSTTEKHYEKPVVLVLTRGHNLSEAVMNYSLNVAGRLQHKILIVYVNTLPFLRSGGSHRERFACSVDENVSVFIEKGKERDVPIAYVKESGKIGKVVSRLCRIIKKIDFIVVDDGVRVEEVVSRSPVPVFNVDKPLMPNTFENVERKNSVRQNNAPRRIQ